MASTLFPIALTPKPTTRDPLGKIPAEAVYHGDCEKKRRSCQNRRSSLGKIEWEPVYHGDHAFFRSRLCQNTRSGLGKIEWEPVYHGDSPRKSGGYAKAGDLRLAWGNSQRNPFIMATTKPSVIRLAKLFGLAKQEGKACCHRSRARSRLGHRGDFGYAVLYGLALGDLLHGGRRRHYGATRIEDRRARSL